MKILVVSMRSIHMIRWVSQLKDSGHDVYWFDILNTGYIEELNWVKQYTNWRYKFGDFKGRTFLKKRLPKLHGLLENSSSRKFQELLAEIKPDIVHSFALHIGAFPILNIMKQHSSIKWLYSSWGSDLYYHQNIGRRRKEIDHVLPHIDYMFSDCERDRNLANSLGFKGEHLGVFPGGGGYDLEGMQQYCMLYEERNYIILKGYNNDFAKGKVALEALFDLPKAMVAHLTLIVYSASEAIQKYLEESKPSNFKSVICHSQKSSLSQTQLFQLFGKSLISIGNNISDGIPNTLIESIILGAFPIQSNPGNASAEIIKDGVNGLLIDNPLDVSEIKEKITLALQSKDMMRQAFEYNRGYSANFDENLIKPQVLQKYADIAIENET